MRVDIGRAERLRQEMAERVAELKRLKAEYLGEISSPPPQHLHALGDTIVDLIPADVTPEPEPEPPRRRHAWSTVAALSLLALVVSSVAGMTTVRIYKDGTDRKTIVAMDAPTSTPEPTPDLPTVPPHPPVAAAPVAPVVAEAAPTQPPAVTAPPRVREVTPTVEPEPEPSATPTPAETATPTPTPEPTGAPDLAELEQCLREPAGHIAACLRDYLDQGK